MKKLAIILLISSSCAVNNQRIITHHNDKYAGKNLHKVDAKERKSKKIGLIVLTILITSINIIY